MAARIRVGLLGAGGIGRVHAEAYREIEGAELVAVADASHEAADKLAGAHGAQAYYDCQALVADGQVDVVDVCLPTYLHAQAVIDAATAGKHVLCEKPVALDLAQADRMVEAVERAGVMAMVAQVVRFTPHYRLIKDLVEQGELGRPLMAAAARLAAAPRWSTWFGDPALSGGAILDLHIHDLDYLFYLFGKPRSVYAVGLRSERGGWDHLLTSLDYGDKKATAEASFLMPAGFPFTATIRVLGEKGCAQYPFGAPATLDPQAAATAEGDLVIYRAGQVPECPSYARRNPYLVEIEYFIGCVARGQAPEIATLQEARTVLGIALAARESLETGRTVGL